MRNREREWEMRIENGNGECESKYYFGWKGFYLSKKGILNKRIAIIT